jgi:hypothetical protein
LYYYGASNAQEMFNPLPTPRPKKPTNQILKKHEKKKK